MKDDDEELKRAVKSRRTSRSEGGAAVAVLAVLEEELLIAFNAAICELTIDASLSDALEDTFSDSGATFSLSSHESFRFFDNCNQSATIVSDDPSQVHRVSDDAVKVPASK